MKKNLSNISHRSSRLIAQVISLAAFFSVVVRDIIGVCVMQASTTKVQLILRIGSVLFTGQSTTFQSHTQSVRKE
ncbi:unnamed protein product [Trifolium pratense]|uniref:Uncharacterized protein n=1 Tax=Trifolium pratense TaxID=57577 RepID=A0ACB0ITC9_TRIPR|nr:unnamed protein product [Trifolium pratense]